MKTEKVSVYTIYMNKKQFWCIANFLLKSTLVGTVGIVGDKLTDHNNPASVVLQETVKFSGLMK